MRAKSLVILCGSLLYLQAVLTTVKAEQGRSEGLGRQDGSTPHRSLLQQTATSAAVWTMPEEKIPAQAAPSEAALQDSLPAARQEEMHQSSSRKERILKGGGGGGRGGGGGGGRGGGGSSGGGRSSGESGGGSRGGASPSRTTFMPASYRGPTTTSASGALTVKNSITTGYPKDGVSTAIPTVPRSGMLSSPKTYDSHRPYTNTYPGGYTLLFIPAYSSDYSGQHWATYDGDHHFSGFDLDDATAGDYDYEDGHDLPAGCQKLDPQSSAQPPNLAGHVSAPAFGPGSAVAAATAPIQASAPGAYMGRGGDFSVRPSSSAPAPAPDAKAASAMLSGSNTSRQVNLLCKPIAAQWDPSGLSRDEKIIIGVLVGFFGTMFIAICVFSCIISSNSNSSNNKPR